MLGVAILFGAVMVVWIGRRPLTALTIQSYLTVNGVASSARVSQATPDRIVFDDVRLGPPAAPDFVARRVIIDVGWAPLAPRIAAITLDSAVVRASVGKGGVSFGSLDRLIPPGRSARFPAIEVQSRGGRIIVDTLAGRVVGHVEASGQLDRNFRALVNTDPVFLRVGSCSGVFGAATFSIATKAASYDVKGHGGMQSVSCADAETPHVDWQATLSGALSSAKLGASATIRLDDFDRGPLRVRGGAMLTARSGGDFKEQAGHWQLRTAAVGTQQDYAGATEAHGVFDWRRGASFHATGTAALSAIASNTLRSKLKTMSILPEPAAAFATQLRSAAEAISARASFDTKFGNAPTLQIGHAEIFGKGGGRLTLTDGAGLRLGAGSPTLDGHLMTGGGGLPTVRATLVQLSRHSGSAQFDVAPWSGGGSIIAVRRGAVAISGDRISVSGAAEISSRFSGVSVDGLSIPLAATIDLQSGVFSLGRGCATVGLRRAVANTIAVGPAAMTACPLIGSSLLTIAPNGMAGRFAVSSFHSTGTLKGQPFSIATKPTTIEIGGTPSAPTIATVGLALHLSQADSNAGGTISGKIKKTSAGWRGSGGVRDASVTQAPLAATNGSAAWFLKDDTVSLANATLRVAQLGSSAKFSPLRLTAVAARIDPAGIHFRSDIRLDSNRDLLGNASGTYEFASRSGSAHLKSSVIFSSGLQPQQISELSRGVIANVEGTLVSTADFNVTPDHTSAIATIKLEGMSLATASLGPITGIEGTVVFDDLLMLHTLPGQLLHIASIDPGVRVEHGVTAFQLLGAGMLHIESMDWPFAGGMLRLQPVTLRTDERRRTLTLDVDGLDAAQFLQRFELKNVNVTGRFDGKLPLVFDGGVGRIDGGMLTARKGGGLLQYVGEVGQDSMGGAGRMAFDALRRLRYQSLALRLDGDLDGELVTAIDFAGTNELPIKPAGGLPLRAAGLPFKFGVTVRAPFRALLGTAASFSDARAVLHTAKPQP